MTCGSSLSFTPFLLFFLCSPVPRDLRLSQRRILCRRRSSSSVATPSLPTLLLPYCPSSATSLPPPEPDHCLPDSAFSNLGSTARRLNSSRPRPISSIRSPRRNPERRLRSVEHHLRPSVLATISGTASALCSPGVPATVAAVLLRHSPLWPATSTTRTLGIPSPWSSLPAVRSNVIHR